MEGLLLRLLEDRRGAPGRWFWPCFAPLRTEFDRHAWVLPDQPWMGAPAAFDYDRDAIAITGSGGTGATVWCPGAVGRWADQFCEEHVELWAVDPAGDPARLAATFLRNLRGRQDAFIEEHAEVWLIYSDSTCWEIFAKEVSLLKTVRDHLQGNKAIRVYDNNSADRRRAYAEAGVAHVWRAMHGHAT